MSLQTSVVPTTRMQAYLLRPSQEYTCFPLPYFPIMQPTDISSSYGTEVCWRTCTSALDLQITTRPVCHWSYSSGKETTCQWPITTPTEPSMDTTTRVSLAFCYKSCPRIRQPWLGNSYYSKNPDIKFLSFFILILRSICGVFWSPEILDQSKYPKISGEGKIPLLITKMWNLI